MSASAVPYGLRPVKMIGGQYFAGAMREYPVASNNAAAIFNGDLVALTTAGLPAAVSSTPVAVKIPATSADATAGIMGVCVGARFVTPAAAGQQPMWAQYLPAGAYTAGYRNIWVQVVDDPNTLFQIKGSALLDTFNSGTNGSGWPGAIGKNAQLGFGTAGSTTTGNSGVNLLTGTAGNGLVATATYAVRIVDIVAGTEGDAYPEFIVKLNVGVHSYTNSLGI